MSDDCQHECPCPDCLEPPASADKVASIYAHQRRVAAIPVGTTHENGLVRIHRYRDSLVVWDLSTAGMRGKKVRVLSILPSSMGARRDTEEFIGRVSTMIEDYTTYNQVLAGVKDYLVDFPEDLTIDERAERGVDVMPAGFWMREEMSTVPCIKPIKIQGKNVVVEAEYKDFVIREVGDPNETTCIPAISGGLKSIPVFYRWVKDNESRIKTMSFHEVLEEMRALGVKYHQYCAMD